MNYKDARQLMGADGKPGFWNYTNMNDDRVYPIGYCTKDCKHNTKEEAYEHYKQYLLDKRVDYDGKMERAQSPCAVCGDFTDKMAIVDGYSMFVLCDTHRNRQEVEKLLTVAQEISS